MKRVYLDHNATTPLRAEARAAFDEALDRLGGNASSVHTSGRRARQLVDEARERVATALGVHEEEIVFTSGGTEANNLALFGVLRPRPGARLVTTAVEHSAVLEPAEALERDGHPVLRIGVDRAGCPPVDELLAAAQGAQLVSVMAANNEVGSLAPLDAIARGLGEMGRDRPLLHTDAVQALGRVPLDLGDIDLASFSAHKVGGPLGAGVLFRRKGVALEGQVFGGGQEGGLRPGTENVPAIVGAACAIELAIREQESYAKRTRALATTLWQEVQRVLPEAKLLGPAIDRKDRLPNTINLSLADVDGRVLVTRLDLGGLEASAGSACASGSLEPSHVLLAMGVSRERARSGLRLSLGRETTAEDIHTSVEYLGKTLASERKSKRFVPRKK